MLQTTSKTQNSVLDLSTLRDNPAQYFDNPEVNFPSLQQAIEADNENFVADLSTDKGRKAITSHARRCSTLKTALDGAGKEKVAAIKQQAAVIDAQRKQLRDYLDQQRDQRRKPLTDWEEQEASRIASHKAIIEGMIQDGRVGFNESSAQIQSRIDQISAIDVSRSALQEFSETAEIKKTAVLQSLAAHLQAAIQSEQQAKELAELRAQKEEQERVAAQERAKHEAEQLAHRQAEEARIAEEQRKLEAERIEREKAEAAARAAQQAKREAEAKAERERQELIEQQRLAEEKRLAEERAERQAAEARAADIEHRKTVNNAACAALMEAASIGEDRAKKIVIAIASGSIPNISINY